MPRILQPLLLPQLVQARRSQDLSREADVEWYHRSSVSLQPTHTSSVTDLSLPPTPTFSVRAHSRYTASLSSVDPGSPSPRSSPPCSSPVADSRDDTYPGKRSLPDVTEEPVEREEALDGAECDRSSGSARHTADDDHLHGTSRFSMFDGSALEYTLADSFVDAGPGDAARTSKRRRGGPGDSPLAAMATRLGTRFPSFARRWTMRRARDSVAADDGSPMERAWAMPSRASSRTSSVGRPYAHRPTTAADDSPTLSPIIGAIADEEGDDGAHARHVTTPLLPPLMIPDPSEAAEAGALRSPLQSPTVAASPAPGTGPVSTLNVSTALNGARSPARTTPPSPASPHRARTGSLPPSSEIPCFALSEPDADDAWATRLGHANFHVQPAPYLPDVFDRAACERLQRDWDAARCNFVKHLARTGEHYGPGSNTYRLTQDKWAEIDGRWRALCDRTVARAHANGALTCSFRRRQALPSPIVTTLPSLSDPRLDGKFPKLGDADIVGPMVQVRSVPAPRRSRRATLVQFLHDVGFPSSLFGRSSSAWRRRHGVGAVAI
ncbi:MAG: hypothetical protein M1826_000861 [Phylliscum demangeonii]|nr:MAG: hypothetical protein M1826_000861 [Phylliscum demangeonii]